MSEKLRRFFGATSDRKVLLCVGPGGVGKTTVAAALGLRAAREGRKAIVVTIDPSRRLAQALGFRSTNEAGAIVTVPGTTELVHPLHCLLLDTKRVFDDIVSRYSPNPNAAQRMQANPIYMATVTHLGGALEYAATARVHMLVDEGNYDLVILDTPPTANAIEFLEAPSRISEVLNNPAARFLATSSGLRGRMRFLGLASSVMLKVFESMGGGPFIGQLGDFLADFGGVLGEFHRRAGNVAELLISPQTGVVLTTSANDFSVREAMDFLEVLRDKRLRVDGVVLNRVDPRVPDLDPQVLERLDPVDVKRVVALHAGLKLQGDRAQAVHRELERRYPSIPVCAIERRYPAPTGIDALADMGEQL